MIDLERVKSYIELGFDKDEAIKIVKGEEAEERKASAKEKAELEKKMPETPNVDFDEMQKKIDELEAKLAQHKDLAFEAKEEETVSVEDAFKNIFAL